MRRRWSCLTLALICSGAPACGEAGDPAAAPATPVAEPTTALRPPELRGVVPADARVVDYHIAAELDEQAHEIHGRMRLRWRNPTRRSVDRLPFHLYMNGFRAEDTAWMASSRGSHRGQRFARDRWGFIEVTRVEQLPGDSQIDGPPEGDELSSRGRPLSFAEDAEPSTMTVTLAEPIGPGESIELALTFTTRLPQVFARTGYYGDFHMAAQWFPKVAVLEEAGGWQAHQFSLFAEFYADFGNYEVALDVPDHYVVGATGILVDTRELDGGRKQLSYRAEMVHDFAWAADPDFVEHWGEYEGIRIRQLIQPERVDDADIHLEAQLATLASMEARFGPYPWSTITIVHAPEGAEGAGGMEYPTLYTTSDIAALPGVPPALLRERLSGVFTTVHEFGHQYFQGLFASNEHAEPWLDEGINTAANHLAYWDRFGEDPWLAKLLGHELSSKDQLSLAMLSHAAQHIVDRPADAFDPLRASYGLTVYQKTAAVMLTLRELCGREPWDRALARYAEQARFRHPEGALLERLLVEEIGGDDGRLALVGDGGADTVWLDVQDFLDQGLRTAEPADFRLLRAGNRRRQGGAGWHRRASGEAPRELPAAARETGRLLTELFDGAPTEGPPGLKRTATGDDWSQSSEALAAELSEGFVVVQRRTAFRVPVEILVEFEGGERRTVIWDGQAPHATFTFPGQRVRRAIVDPRQLLIIEARKLDNAAWASEAKRPEDPLVDWVGDMAEAGHLATLAALGI